MKRALVRRRRHGGREAGQAILEMAMILPVFVLVGFGLCDMQWCISRAGAVEYIAEEVARCEGLASPACTDPSAYATRLAGNVRLDATRMTVSGLGCNPGLSCHATVEYAYQPIGVWFPAIVIRRTGEAAIPPIQ